MLSAAVELGTVTVDGVVYLEYFYCIALTQDQLCNVC